MLFTVTVVTDSGGGGIYLSSSIFSSHHHKIAQRQPNFYFLSPVVKLLVERFYRNVSAQLVRQISEKLIKKDK